MLRCTDRRLHSWDSTCEVHEAVTDDEYVKQEVEGFTPAHYYLQYNQPKYLLFALGRLFEAALFENEEIVVSLWQFALSI